MVSGTRLRPVPGCPPPWAQRSVTRRIGAAGAMRRSPVSVRREALSREMPSMSRAVVPELPQFNRETGGVFDAGGANLTVAVVANDEISAPSGAGLPRLALHSRLRLRRPFRVRSLGRARARPRAGNSRPCTRGSDRDGPVARRQRKREGPRAAGPGRCTHTGADARARSRRANSRSPTGAERESTARVLRQLGADISSIRDDAPVTIRASRITHPVSG